MAPDLTEKRFEQDIESWLLTKGGYVKGNQTYHLKDKALDLSEMIAFIRATQPKEWARYMRTYPENPESVLYRRFQSEVEAKGLVSVLRKGVKDRGITLRFAYFAPASSLNQDLVDLYNHNILSCHRQFAYSQQNHNTVDMVLSLNGIPIVALELKNQFTGQSVDDSKWQFITSRDPRELMFQFNKRILVFFAVDLTEVWMCTRLQKENTFFLPFNQGSGGAGEVGGSGNPENPEGYQTAYLWEKTLKRDRLLSLLQRFISLEKNREDSRKDRLIFPRYHQLDVVEKLTADVQQRGSGKNYLIQHSAGSGKSNSIAWLTYRLASLHDNEDKEIFNSVFVVTDRRVLNRQLQDTVTGFEHKPGMILTITDQDNSQKLKEAIEDGKKIIITTLHRFPIIRQQVEEQKGKRFAVIVDEAHSSQTGTAARQLTETLADTQGAMAELALIEGRGEEGAEDGEDFIIRQMLLTHGRHANLSFFAFTATPKPKTLETFGEQLPDGRFRAFHIYSMRQAIEEGFILDVLRYYTTVENSYAIIKNIPDNPEMPEPPTVKAIKEFHHSHADTIARKTELMVEKFREITLTKIEGKAKAMVVTASRAHAVKYFQAIRKYAAEKGYTDVRPLVSFSGEIKIGEESYTEPQLNSRDGKNISESQLPKYFEGDDYNLLVVAEKYQTGFDEPRLHTMFVDKGLRGVKAVQTLSRLNRIATGKTDTYVLDFVNTADSIRESFLPFYEDTMLSEAIDPNLVYTFKERVEAFCLFNGEDVERFCALFLKKDAQTATDLGRLAGLVKGAVTAYSGLEEEKRFEARDAIRQFNRAYSYVVQIVRLFDKELHEYYLFCEYLWRLLPTEKKPVIDLNQKIILEKNRLTETFSGEIKLPGGEGKAFPPQKDNPNFRKPDKKELLENIINKINLIHESNLTGADRVIIETIYDKLFENNEVLARFAKTTDAEMFAQSIFPGQFQKVAQDCYNDQVTSFAKLFEDKAFYNNVMTQMARSMYQGMRNGPGA